MFDDKGLDSAAVLENLQALLQKDATYSSGRPVASMSTIPDRLGVDILAKYIEKNAGRMHTFQGSQIIEEEVVGMIGDLLHLKSPYGVTTSGGTESNILAMLSFREMTGKKIKSPQVIAPKTIHSSVDKAAWLLGMTLKKTDIDVDFRAEPASIEKAINKNTIGIFATAGTTYVGQVDPIDRIAAIASDHGLPLHVDAAFGGFVIPFLHDLGLGNYPFDFAIDGVTSVSTDPHKMGLAPIPAGCITFRMKEALDSITRGVPYLRGASSKQSTLLGTRPAATILATWAVMKHLGREGYRQTVARCMKTTLAGVTRIETSPQLELAFKPIMNILAVRTRQVPLDYVVDRMEERGWRMAISPMPKTMRLVIMPHVTDGVMNAFFNDLDQISTTIPAALRETRS